MVLLPCSPCCVTCDSFNARRPPVVTSQITAISTDIFGNAADCDSTLRQRPPYDYWYSRDDYLAPDFPLALFFDNPLSSNTVYEQIVPVNTGPFLVNDFIRFVLSCNVFQNQLFLEVAAIARLRGEPFIGTGVGVGADALNSPLQLEAATTINVGLGRTVNGQRALPPSECASFANLEIAWPGLNPLP